MSFYLVAEQDDQVNHVGVGVTTFDRPRIFQCNSPEEAEEAYCRINYARKARTVAALSMPGDTVYIKPTYVDGYATNDSWRKQCCRLAKRMFDLLTAGMANVPRSVMVD